MSLWAWIWAQILPFPFRYLKDCSIYSFPFFSRTIPIVSIFFFFFFFENMDNSNCSLPKFLLFVEAFLEVWCKNLRCSPPSMHVIVMQLQNNNGELYFNNINNAKSKTNYPGCATYNIWYKAWQYINLGVTVWPLLVQHLTKGYCLRRAWHKSSVVMKTVYVRRKSSRRVSAEEGKKAQGRTYYWGGKEYILHLLCMAGIGFPSPFQVQNRKNASKFKFQTVPNMLPLQRSDSYLTSTFSALKEPTSRNYAQNKPQFRNQ